MSSSAGHADTAAAEAYLAQHRSRHIDELRQFLAIPSVSALPEHGADIDRAARWLADAVRAVGFPEVRILSGIGNPVVYGHWQVDDDATTVIIYGHYDVQPADPLDLWHTPPFEPVVREYKLFARGASDDKGNLWIVLKALEAVSAVAGKPPINIKLLFEGEEEIGSPHLAAFLAANAALLRADVAISADGGQWSADTPALTIGSRGLVALQIAVEGARSDLHSGSYGGAVQNPIHALAQLLAGMRGPDGRILVDGFYDQVRELSAAERADLASIPMDERAYAARLGVSELFGEAGYTTLERTWVRPTLEVNGIWGGFQGEGVKTVLPSKAHAKITCRLVPDQDPDAVAKLIEDHVGRNSPPGVTVRVRRFSGSARPYLMPRDHPALHVAAEVLEEVYGRQALVIRTGGTIPIAEAFRSVLDMWFVFFAFGEPDNNVHAPNEFLRLASFDRGVQAYYRLLYRLRSCRPHELGVTGR